MIELHLQIWKPVCTFIRIQLHPLRSVVPYFISPDLICSSGIYFILDVLFYSAAICARPSQTKIRCSFFTGQYPSRHAGVEVSWTGNGEIVPHYRHNLLRLLWKYMRSMNRLWSAKARKWPNFERISTKIVKYC